jgi:uncharacterized protein (TIGR03435 family)
LPPFGILMFQFPVGELFAHRLTVDARGRLTHMLLSTARIVALLVATAPALAAYQASREAGGPVFEVASVRQNTSGDSGGSSSRQGNQIVIRNYPLRTIIAQAYNLRQYQIEGGPDWITSTRFDIVAKEPDGVPPAARMMHALLADRFKLRVHAETRQMPVYALVVQRADRRLGPQLQAARPDSTRGGNAVPGRIRFRAYSTSDLARNLSNWAGRLVLDRTDLIGAYDGELSWMPDDAPAGVVDPNAPSLFGCRGAARTEAPVDNGPSGSIGDRLGRAADIRLTRLISARV